MIRSYDYGACIPPALPSFIAVPARMSMQRTNSSPLLFKSVFRDAEIVHELVKGGGGDGTAPFARSGLSAPRKVHPAFLLDRGHEHERNLTTLELQHSAGRCSLFYVFSLIGRRLPFSPSSIDYVRLRLTRANLVRGGKQVAFSTRKSQSPSFFLRARCLCTPQYQQSLVP